MTWFLLLQKLSGLQPLLDSNQIYQSKARGPTFELFQRRHLHYNCFQTQRHRRSLGGVTK